MQSLNSLRNSRLLLSLCLSVALLSGCGKAEVPSPKSLGFSSEQEMQQIQAKGWRTKARYESDMRDARLEAALVACYGPYRHAANVAKARGEPRADLKESVAVSMRKGLSQIWVRKGFDELGAAERVDSIYDEYPPARPELYVEISSAKAANEAGIRTSKVCDAHIQTGVLSSIVPAPPAPRAARNRTR